MADKTLVQVFTQKREFELNCGKIAYEQVYKGHSGVNVNFIAIDKCFRNETVYDVRRFETGNKTSEEVKQWFTNLADGHGHVKATDYGTFIFIFLTTLKSNHRLVVGKDDSLAFEDIFDTIKTKPVMAGKPKIFIVQADDEEIVKKIAEQQPQDKSKLKLPQDADRLVIMSTLPQVLSNLDKFNLPRPNIPYYEMYKSEGMTQCYNLKYTPVALSEGMADIRTKEQEMEASPLIQAFVTIVEDNRSKEKVLDLFSLTPLLNGKVNDMITSFKKSLTNIHFPIPFVSSTLTRNVHLK